VERIAVMAALVVTHELLVCRQESNSLHANVEAHLERALDAVEATLRKCSEIAV
jgi:cell division protein ZapA (FtsZ GTPase activity inhibitor)